MKFAVLEKLLEKAPLNDEEIVHLTPYYRWFARSGDMETLERMMKLVPSHHEKMEMRQQSLIEAAAYGQMDMVVFLLNTPTPIKFIRYDQYKPIREAVAGGHRAIAEYLIERAARNPESKEALCSQLKLDSTEWDKIVKKTPENFLHLDMDAYADPEHSQQLPEKLKGYSSFGFDAGIYNHFLDLCALRCKLKGIEDGAEKRAYNASILFRDVVHVDKYLDKSYPGKPSHTFFDYKLPPAGKWDIESWRNLAIRHGYAVYPYLRYAVQIEDKHQEWLPERPLADLSVAEIEHLAFAALYEGSEQHPDVARIGAKLGLSQKQFDQTVEALKRACPAQDDQTPLLNIHGENLGLPGYRLIKIAKNDPVNFWIGGFPKINNCCKIGRVITQDAWGGDIGGAELALAQSHWSDLSLYAVVNEKGNFCAKFSGWIKGDTFVFNSWQSYGKKYQFLMLPFVTQAAVDVLEQNPSIQKIHIGAGPLSASKEYPAGKYKTGKIDHIIAQKGGWLPVDSPVHLEEDTDTVCAYDCQVQLEVTNRHRLDQTKARLRQIIQDTRIATSQRTSARHWF